MTKAIDHQSRAHALLSASGAELWLNCPASAIANAQYTDEGSEYAQEGTIAHEVAQVYAEAVLSEAGHGELDAGLRALRSKWGDEAVTGEMLECAESYAAYIRERVTDSAVVLLEQRLDFSPWVPDGFGTGDCVIIDEGVLTVIDYKYGQGIAVESEGNPQMRLYALGAINEYDLVYAFDQVAMSIYQPRINNVSEARMAAADLMDWGEEVVKPAALEACSPEARYHAGAHCRRFCRHAGRCRALSEYCSDFVETHGLRAAVPHLTAEDYLRIVQTEPLIRLWLDKTLHAATDAILAGQPLDGLKVVEGRSLRRWSDERKAFDALVAAGFYGDDLMEPAAVKSVAAMEKALGKRKVAETVGELIVRIPGKPTLALSSDKRPSYNPGADFEALD